MKFLDGRNFCLYGICGCGIDGSRAGGGSVGSSGVADIDVIIVLCTGIVEVVGVLCIGAVQVDCTGVTDIWVGWSFCGGGGERSKTGGRVCC